MKPIIKTESDPYDPTNGWGEIPAIRGDLATAIPDPTDPTVPTDTTATQSSGTATSNVVQQKLLPPPPPPAACIANNAFTPAFYSWLLKLQERVGGFVSSPATDDAQLLQMDTVGASSQVRSEFATITAILMDSPTPAIQDSAAQIIAEPQRVGGWLQTDKPVLRKESGKGLMVDPVSPSYPWHDMLGPIVVKGTGGTDPAWATYRGGIKGYQFTVNDEVWLVFHIPHDYLPGSDLYIHAHWSHNSAAVTGGSVTWGFEITYAKGHNQAAFSTPVTRTVQQSASTVQYRHMIAETQMSAASPSASQIDSDLIEVDGLIMVRCYLSANAITGVATEPFLHTVDIHYQSTGMGTKQKAPDFYT